MESKTIFFRVMEFLVVIIVAFIVLFTTYWSYESRKLENEKYVENNFEDENEYLLISRDQWIAQPPNEVLVDLKLPSLRVVIAHTATEECQTQAECMFRIRLIQTFHMASRKFDDIAYNFLVGGDGAVYEGRGWDKMGAHSKGYNANSICIAFIGTFNKICPPNEQLEAAKSLIDDGLKLGKLSKDFQLFGHRQLTATESPGDVLYNIIKKWPHYNSKKMI